MKKKIVAISLVILFTAALLAGCGTASAETLYVYNWGVFMDTSVLAEFESEYNCKVVYENYASNEEMYYKIKGGNAVYDVIFPSDYMIEKMVEEDLLLPLNYDNIPNYANIDERTLNKDFDPANVYSVPYFWGTLGIIYNTNYVEEEITSWNALFDEKYQGQILMYDSQRDSMAVALSLLGYSINSTNESELEEAYNLLVEQKPLVMAYVNDQVIDMMIGSEAHLAVVYSGDGVYCMSMNESLKYVVPQEGSNYWFDNMAIPASCENQELAEAFINFMCRDDIAIRNTMEVGYSSSNKAAMAAALEEEEFNNEAYNPTDEILARCSVFRNLGDEYVQKYADYWTRVKAH